MEKELFHLLQELKICNNKIDVKNMQQILDNLYYECNHSEDKFDYYNRLYFLNNIKLLLLKMVPFFNKKEKIKCILKKEKLDRIMDYIEIEYNNLEIGIIAYEAIIDISKNRKNELKKNMNQIDCFLNFINNLSADEKQKIFNYKMGYKYE